LGPVGSSLANGTTNFRGLVLGDTHRPDPGGRFIQTQKAPAAPPMDIDQLLTNLRRQYGVSSEFAESVRPLLESAARAPKVKRNRLRALVERSFAVEARSLPKVQRVRLREDEPVQLLQSMAELLHGWAPRAWEDNPT